VVFPAAGRTVLRAPSRVAGTSTVRRASAVRSEYLCTKSPCAALAQHGLIGALLFNSFSFLLFFPIVLGVYYALSDYRKQNLWLLAASLFFYGSWDWRFLGLLGFTIIVDYLVARRIQTLRDLDRGERSRMLLLAASIVANLGVLAFFKYYNFFQDNVNGLAGILHVPASLPALHVALAIGISFFTFQSMSYTIDVYRGHLRAADRLSDFALFVSFFPHLVAGPIMRAIDLLPQIELPRRTTREQVSAGINLIVWGFWKKMFVADNLAPVVNDIFSRANPNGFDVLIGAYAFAFQIYGDFSGYTDIARGVAKLLGFELTLNFNRPYLAASPQEFWTRWHISLSTWLREYLYFSLGGNRGGAFLTYRNLLLTMVIGGLWHGAAWNFIAWGFYQGVLLIVHRALSPVMARLEATRVWKPVLRVFAVIVMFQFTCYGWLLFRASSLAQIETMSRALFLAPWHIDLAAVWPLIFFAAPLVALDLAGSVHVANVRWWRPPMAVRIAGYSVLAYLTIFFAAKPQGFIYFKF
jgi:alginate O-acetyltransferase complex protein AlgI